MENDDLDHTGVADDAEVGIPEKMRVRRDYTMSAAALEQRRQAASQPKPGMAGLRNAWKHGKYASSFLTRLKPCKTTCPQYPCELVADNVTEPGKDCLDKLELLNVIRAVHSALKDPKDGLADFQEIAAVNIANSIRILEMLQEDIMRDGTVIKSSKMTKFGTEIEYKLHPALLALPKMIQDLNLTPEQFLITPKAQAKVEGEKEAAKTIGEMLGAAGKQLAQAKAANQKEG